LRDPLGRRIDYLRISITDRCNLRCAYCMPAEGIELRPHDEILRFEEIERLARVAAGLGFKHFRVTGGEPLARRGAPSFVARLAGQLRGLDLALTTNGTLLAPVAAELARGGLGRVNISLDTLDAGKFARLARRDLWPQAWAGVGAAMAAGLDPVKINVVVVRGHNDDEILDFARLTLERPLHVRFIELMPLGEGCGAGGGPVPSDEILARLAVAGELLPLAGGEAPAGAGPAEAYRWRGGAGSVGVIAALSHKFCGHCNRLRLTADGRLEPCLGSEASVDLRGPMRAGAGDAALAELFRAAAAIKPACHHMEEAAAAAAVAAAGAGGDGGAGEGGAGEGGVGEGTAEGPAQGAAQAAAECSPEHLTRRRRMSRIGG
jgi:cyclic pyranopterin phosphate synthase